MKITRNNYEAFFLDYYEDNLSPEQVALLMVFLEENEDLKEEFNDFEDIILLTADNTVGFDKKNELKKKEFVSVGKIDGTNYEDYFIAALEGDLTERELADVTAFLGKNPHTKLEYNAFRSTFLKPEEIVYNDKESLKKRGLFVVYRPAVLYAVSIAASILIFFGIYSLLNRTGTPDTEPLQISKIEIIPAEINVTKTVVPEIIQTSTSMTPAVASAEKNDVILQEEPAMVNTISPKGISKIETVAEAVVYIDIPASENAKGYANALAINDSPEDMPKRKSFMARFLSSVVRKAIPARRTEKRSFIEYTVSGYNLIADRDVEVEKQYDSDGNIIAYNVIGDNIEFVKRVKNPVKE
jgi:hypothetical protein